MNQSQTQKLDLPPIEEEPEEESFDRDLLDIKTVRLPKTLDLDLILKE